MKFIKEIKQGEQYTNTFIGYNYKKFKDGGTIFIISINFIKFVLKMEFIKLPKEQKDDSIDIIG